MSFADELRRRSVFRVAAAYLVVGWLLTEVLTTILPELGAPDWAARTVILLFALGFLPTVVLSWIYEITPEGIKRESELEPGDGPRRRHGKFDYAIIATVFALVAALAFLGARTTTVEDSSSDDSVGEASLAVLPFVNMSSDPDNVYFSDGLTETLLHMLTQVPELEVAARTSSFAFKGQNKNISEIARDLQVAYVLEGSVQKSGSRVRITAQLIRADDGFHVWSESFDRTYDDIFAVQDEIALRVADALTLSLLGTSPTTTAVAGISTQNADAYDLYLQALGIGSNLSYGGLQAAENMLEAALATDPGFLDAKVQLAVNYLEQRETGLLASNDALDRIDALTSEVLIERPDDPLVEALSLFSNVIRHDVAATPETFFDSVDGLEALVDANPGNSQISIMLGDLLIALQRYDRALEVLLEAVGRDQFNARLHFEIGLLHSLMGRLEDSRAATARSLELQPNQPSAYMLLSRLARLEGDGVEVIRQLLNALNEDPRDHELPGDIGLFLYGMGLFEAGDDFRNLVNAMAPESEHALLLDLARAVQAGDWVAADAAARHAITADIGSRRGGFPKAVLFLLREGVRNDNTDEVAGWLEAQAPGLFDIDATSVTSKYRQAQVAAIEPWFATLPHDEFVARSGKLLGIANEFGLNPAADPNSRLAIQLMMGDNAAARETALQEVFPQPVTRHLNWKRVFAQPLYSDFVSDQDVQAAFSRWQQQYDSMRDDVATYLASLSAEE